MLEFVIFILAAIVITILGKEVKDSYNYLKLIKENKNRNTGNG